MQERTRAWFPVGTVEVGGTLRASAFERPFVFVTLAPLRGRVQSAAAAFAASAAEDMWARCRAIPNYIHVRWTPPCGTRRAVDVRFAIFADGGVLSLPSQDRCSLPATNGCAPLLYLYLT